MVPVSFCVVAMGVAVILGLAVGFLIGRKGV